MTLTLQLVVLLGLSSGLWMGANAKCPKKGDCCMVCPDGWMEHDSRCYMFHAGEKDWCDAESTCVAQGGNLVSIRKPEDADFLRGKVQELTGEIKRLWLGGYKAHKETCWKWSDGSDITGFTSWGDGEPNNVDGIEHCMELMHTDVQPINDAPCDVLKGFFCARDLEMQQD
ncbi:galactose-specific lectin nattectin-like [Xyrichtys novacula]|uniref:Galactose-specific lectin nattectin-like n=1 Tax=Xyrichtys novacula TaxID=13765 RepID=A0AAV1FFV6_XYRNO|nr:galactose-specific lectin nattectin-like [Xyrichtys novacula]